MSDGDYDGGSSPANGRCGWNESGGRCSRDCMCADGPMPEVYHRTQSTPGCPPHDSGGPQRREETSQQSPQTLRLYCRRYSYNLARLSRGKSRSWITSVANPWEKERPNSGGQG